MRFASSLTISGAFVLAGCNLVLGVVPLSGEDLGGGVAQGGGGGGGAGSGGEPAGGSEPGGGGSGGTSTCTSPCATVEWATSFGSPSDDDATGLALGPNGRVLVTGDFLAPGMIGTTDIGTGGYIAQLSATQGEAVGALPGENTSSPLVTIDDAGNGAIAGSYDGNIVLGGSPFSGRGAFFARQASGTGMLTGADVLLASDAAADVKILSIALGPDGSIAICGGYKGTVDFAGHGPETSAGANSDAFVMVIPSSGSPWVRSFGLAGTNNSAQVIAFRDDGNVVVGLRKQGAIDLGFETAPAGTGMILLALDAANGDTLQVSEQFKACLPKSMVVGSDGMIYLGGTTTGTCDFGDLLVLENTAWAALIDPAFQSSNTEVPRLWSLDGLSGETPVAVAPAQDGTGDVLVGGSFATDASSKSLGPLHTAGGYDLLLARLDPATGDAVYVATFGSDLNETLSAISVGPSRAIVTGSFTGPNLVLVDEPLTLEGGDDVFVASLLY